MAGVTRVGGYSPELHEKLEVIASFDKLSFLLMRVQPNLSVMDASLSNANQLHHAHAALRDLSAALHSLEMKLTSQHCERLRDARVIRYLPVACRNLRYLNAQLNDPKCSFLMSLFESNVRLLDKIRILALAHLPLIKKGNIPALDTAAMLPHFPSTPFYEDYEREPNPTMFHLPMLSAYHTAVEILDSFEKDPPIGFEERVFKLILLLKHSHLHLNPNQMGGLCLIFIWLTMEALTKPEMSLETELALTLMYKVNDRGCEFSCRELFNRIDNMLVLLVNPKAKSTTFTNPPTDVKERVNTFKSFIAHLHLFEEFGKKPINPKFEFGKVQIVPPESFKFDYNPFNMWRPFRNLEDFKTKFLDAIAPELHFYAKDKEFLDNLQACLGL